jgi:nucleotide-binding universal stress UspA family protein
MRPLFSNVRWPTSCFHVRKAMDALPTPEADPQSHGHHILVCLDGSPSSEVSLPYVLVIAKTFGSTVTLVRVLEQPQPNHSGPHMSDVLGWEISRREAGGYLERLQMETTKSLGQPVQVRLEQGEAGERVVQLASEIGADLVVLSNHGKGGNAAAPLGRTVQQVLAIARSSVFIVHTSTTTPAAPPKRLLLPLDGSQRTESVLPTAARIARAYGAELLLVHVVQEQRPTLVLNAPEDLALVHELAMHLDASASRYLEELRARLTHEAASVRTLVVRHANERQALLDVSIREHADLIVLSAHGSACDPGHSFGSVTTDLLAHSQLPMLVLQDIPEQEAARNRDGHPSSAPPVRASYAPEVE